MTAVYAAGMASCSSRSGASSAYLFLSHVSLVLVGLELHTSVSLTGALCLWFSVTLSLAGFGLTLRALEARFGRLSLEDFHGLYEHSPTLAVCFLVTGLASVGFPGTLGFVSTELLVDGTDRGQPPHGDRGSRGGSPERYRGRASLLPALHRSAALLAGFFGDHRAGAVRAADANRIDPRRRLVSPTGHRPLVRRGRAGSSSS